MPAYKLTYFNIKGKGEIIRLLFAVAGVEYEDHRIERADWDNQKAKVNPPFGQLPLLTIDGHTYCQSISIARYLAEKFGLAGGSDIEKLRCDMLVHCTEDMLMAFVAVWRESDAEKKAQLAKKYITEQLPVYYGNFEKVLKENKGGDGFFVGDSLTVADLTFYHYVSNVSMYTHAGASEQELKDLLKKYPKLHGLIERVDKHPKVAAWIAKRPVTAN